MYLKHTVNEEYDKVTKGSYGGEVHRFSSSSLGPWLVHSASWLAGVKLALPKLNRFIVDKLLQASAEFAVEVEKYVPNYSHIATEERVNMSLAKRTL